MQDADRIKAAFFVQTGPKGVPEILAGGVAGEIGRLVDGQQCLVLEKDGVASVDLGFFDLLEVVFQRVPWGQEGIGGRLASVEKEPAGGNLRQPSLPGVVGEPAAEEVQQRRSGLFLGDNDGGRPFEHQNSRIQWFDLGPLAS